MREQETLIDETIVAKTKVELKIRHCDVDNIITSSIEGGSNYWMIICNDKPEWDNKPKGMPISEWMVRLILEGKTVYLEVTECEGYQYPLTLKKLLKGIRLNHLRRPWDNNLDNMDATTADCIIQYAVFGDVIYG
jgi:hypothetical protein